MRTLAWLTLAILVAGAWIYFTYSTSGAEESHPTLTAEVEAVPDRTPLPETIEIPVETGTDEATSTPGRLSVREPGLGRGVVDRRLVGRSERFEEGGVAWFSTRVLGGEPGDSIRHVWLREGRLVESIPLELGGPHWRTHSHKTLWGIGQWTVEVRDTEDRVLATVPFVCVPAGSM
jgi:hypothetical protein